MADRTIEKAILTPDGVSYEPSSGERPTLYFQVEAWGNDDGVMTAMAVSMGHACGRAWMLSHDARDGSWKAASGQVNLSRSPVDSAVVAEFLEWGHASGDDLRAFGLDGGTPTLAEWLPFDVGNPGVWSPAADAGADVRNGQAALRKAAFGYTKPPVDMLQPRLGGWMPGGRYFREEAPPAGRLHGAGMSHVVELNPFESREGDDFEVLQARVAERLVPLVTAGFLRATFDGEALRILGRFWNKEAHAFYAAQGETGRRRRQAAAIYPGLAVVIAAAPRVASCIDAGRPFEWELAKRMNDIRVWDEKIPFDVARLRRMRTMPSFPFQQLENIVEVSARLPAPWLPGDDMGWKCLAMFSYHARSHWERSRLDPADLVRPASGDIRALAGSLRGPGSMGDKADVEVGMRVYAALSGSKDLAARLSDTLVSQVIRGHGLRLATTHALALSGTILFKGRSLVAIDRLQRDWHHDLEGFEAALPGIGEMNAWPVAFAPFRASNGLEVTCLANEIELRREGATGQDATGANGLGHCVGGYGRRCYTGTSHIASVRRLVDGGFERVSTVELALSDGALRVIQHKSAGNAEAPPEAVAAIAELLAAFADGSHSLQADALEKRSDDGFRGAYDWRDTETMAAVLDAWRPYLPRDLAKSGLDAFTVRVLKETERWIRPVSQAA